MPKMNTFFMRINAMLSQKMNPIRTHRTERRFVIGFFASIQAPVAVQSRRSAPLKTHPIYSIDPGRRFRYSNGNDSQFDSEPAERAAVAPRGGRVLIAFKNLSNPIANRRWGFCFKTKPRRHN